MTLNNILVLRNTISEKSPENQMEYCRQIFDYLKTQDSIKRSELEIILRIEKEANNLLFKLAEKGVPEAMHKAGLLLARDSSPGHSYYINQKEGIKFLEKAAQAGLDEAKFDLAIIYLYEAGNRKRGLELLQELKSTDNQQAIQFLADYYK